MQLQLSKNERLPGPTFFTQTSNARLEEQETRGKPAQHSPIKYLCGRGCALGNAPDPCRGRPRDEASRRAWRRAEIVRTCLSKDEWEEGSGRAPARSTRGRRKERAWRCSAPAVAGKTPPPHGSAMPTRTLGAERYGVWRSRLISGQPADTASWRAGRESRCSWPVDSMASPQGPLGARGPAVCLSPGKPVDV